MRSPSPDFGGQFFAPFKKVPFDISLFIIQYTFNSKIITAPEKLAFYYYIGCEFTLHLLLHFDKPPKPFLSDPTIYGMIYIFYFVET